MISCKFFIGFTELSSLTQNEVTRHATCAIGVELAELKVASRFVHENVKTRHRKKLRIATGHHDEVFKLLRIAKKRTIVSIFDVVLNNLRQNGVGRCYNLRKEIVQAFVNEIGHIRKVQRLAMSVNVRILKIVQCLFTPFSVTIQIT